MLGPQNEREWGAFCKLVLQRPDLATDPRFASNSKRVSERQALCIARAGQADHSDRPASSTTNDKMAVRAASSPVGTTTGGQNEGRISP
jgi:crotonobetainyl-CoA:carnitine CoA-transferase CaiB-like acyl-CoA transferase